VNSAEANQIAARETAAIQQVVKRARFRIRLQGAMEGVTTAITGVFWACATGALIMTAASTSKAIKRNSWRIKTPCI
jgi:hypothetical protein